MRKLRIWEGGRWALLHPVRARRHVRASNAPWRNLEEIFPEGLTLQSQACMVTPMSNAYSTRRIGRQVVKSRPFEGTVADAHRHNAALFARKGDAGRYLLALQNVARAEGSFEVAK